jgi:hypothetical protein
VAFHSQASSEHCSGTAWPCWTGTLQRHGLAVLDANAEEALQRLVKDLQLDAARREPQRKRGIAAVSTAGRPSPGRPKPPSWSPTGLGELVFLRFRDAGAEVPDVWISSPAG